MQKINVSTVSGALAVGLAALLWSLDGVFIRPQFYRLPAGLVVFLEHGLGFLVLLPFLIRGRKEILKIPLQSWASLSWICLWGGLLGTFFITKAFFAAYDPETGTSLATVVILQKLQPVFALLLARLILKERLRGDFYLWASIAILAAYVLAFAKAGMQLRDIRLIDPAALYALLAAFAFGSSTVFGKHFTRNLRFETAAALRFGGTMLLSLVFILLAGQARQMPAIEPLHWKLLLLIVFSSGAMSMFIYYFGLKRIPASVASIFELAWPLSAVLLDYLIHGSSLNILQYFSAAVLLFAFFMIIRRKPERSRNKKEAEIESAL
ncbi:MAG: DMT family transporter [Candidatus Neomarinimicrobiota bacterium]|jgi:drug/metabolite transporter (DMT)-like permease|nr:DMT family transporter [Candidatus Neomarinimicrobiota bacterium]MDD3966386.1 DMT family transporter [Candidatus Neomarinimicrobiota bacterium]MDX9780548.1 DMT family transporter [bacterium]